MSTLAVISGDFLLLMCAIVLTLVLLLAMLLAVLRFDALRTGRNARPLSVTTGSRSGISCSVNTLGGGSTSSVVTSEPVSLDVAISVIVLEVAAAAAMVIVGAESITF